MLNTTVLLLRYPTTATNRNRARSRWTYYHFLGLDIEKSASRTTDPEALADTNNPTMHNPACTVCHSVLDPVAGAFQNYGEEGYFRDGWKGLDALDGFYKHGSETEEPWAAGQGTFEITARSRSDRQTLSVSAWLGAGRQRISLRPYFDPPRDEDEDIYWHMAIDHVAVRNASGQVLQRIELHELDPDEMCGHDEPRVDEESGEEYYEAWFCRQDVFADIPADGNYEVEAVLWERTGTNVYSRTRNRGRFVAFSVGGYQEGDTWYRDMRHPGMAHDLVPDADTSLPWLARKIAADERFAEATVKFWWPAIMGSDVVEPPAEGDADFRGRLLASNAQAAEVERLAGAFRRGLGGGKRYNLKDLLTEIVLSKWFRTQAITGDNPIRAVALASAGARRLLTPEELARKTVALTGFDWRRSRPDHWTRPGDRENWTNAENGYGLLYGGIDSDGITERGRDLTSIMAGVAQRHAMATACPVALKEFYLLPKAERRLFAGTDVETSPGQSGRLTPAAERSIRSKLVELHDSMLGVDLAASSPEVDAALALFLDVWTRHDRGRDFGGRCDPWRDEHYFDGIADDIWREELDESDDPKGWDWDRMHEFLWEETDRSDPHGLARTWMVMLAYLMTDPRYLHL